MNHRWFVGLLALAFLTLPACSGRTATNGREAAWHHQQLERLALHPLADRSGVELLVPTADRSPVWRISESRTSRDGLRTATYTLIGVRPDRLLVVYECRTEAFGTQEETLDRGVVELPLGR